MARTTIYLNFMGNTEEAFEFYKQVFGAEYAAPINRMSEIPPQPGQPPLSEEEAGRILHVELPIFGGLVLMGTDMLESMGHQLNQGNNISINLEPDTRAETDGLFATLSAGGKIETPLAETFWDAYYGSCVDKFGIHWMFNCAGQD